MAHRLLDAIEKIEPNRRNEYAKDILREAYKKSLYRTAKFLLGYSDINPRTHGGMIRALESDKKRKLIIMPRGTFKSSIGSVAYPIWLLLNNSDYRILLDSELYTNSKNFVREITRHLENPSVTELFGQFASGNWNEGEITIAQRTRILKEASITCGGIGTTKVGQHYDVIIGDDYNSPTNSRTPEMRMKVIDHYRYNQSILEPNGIYAIIGTRYAANDLPGHIIENEIENVSTD